MKDGSNYAEPMLSNEYAGKYLIPCRTADYNDADKQAIKNLVKNFYQKPLSVSEDKTEDGLEQVPTPTVQPSSELAETIVSMLQAGGGRKEAGPPQFPRRPPAGGGPGVGDDGEQQAAARWRQYHARNW